MAENRYRKWFAWKPVKAWRVVLGDWVDGWVWFRLLWRCKDPDGRWYYRRQNPDKESGVWVTTN